MKEYLLENMNRVYIDLESLKSKIQKFVQNKEFNLEDRWSVFTLFGSKFYCLHDNFYKHPDGIDWDTHTLIDDFYVDKYQITNCECMLETALENNLFEENGEELFKEYFLDKFIYSFENDW